MKLRALLFEDTELLRITLTSILEKKDYEVYSFVQPGFCPIYLDQKCQCGHDSACADIIITDINMPGITGWKFIENQIIHGCKVKNIAVMSGEWNKDDYERAKKLGCQIFEKPFDISDFKTWLTECEKRIDLNRKLSKYPDRENKTSIQYLE